MHVACVATGICLGVLRHRVNATVGNASEPYSSDGGAHGENLNAMEGSETSPSSLTPGSS